MAADPMGIGAAADPLADLFRRLLEFHGAPEVLELGTRRWESDRPTHHQEWVPHAARYVKADIQAGDDVDVVADVHHLGQQFPPADFDAVIAVAVWEHLERPWIAARRVADVLRPGGLVYVETHQTFPVHGYPSDFTRWTDAGLRILFEDAGLEVIDAGMRYPCQIIPPAEVVRWNPAAEAYLNVSLLGRKP